jgi:hypothetical protein
VDRSFHSLHDVNIMLLNLGRGHVGIGDDPVDVAFEGIRSGFFNLGGVLNPSANRAAVQAGYDRDFDGRFGFADVLEIVVGTEVEFRWLGKIAGAFRVTLGALAQVEVEFETLLTQLLLEE